MENNQHNFTGFEIAIIGMAGTFPQSPSVHDFWQQIVEGKELISFFSPEELAANGVEKSVYKNKKFVNAFGKMDDKDCFDAAFFKYLPAEAEIMDPQTRLFHQVVWTALEDAGVQWDQSSNDIGLYAGAKDNPLWKSYTSYFKKVQGLDYYTLSLLNSKDSLATLISYKLGLKGPSIALNTTCSTSLVAVHLAARALLMGECKMAVAGGVSLSATPLTGYLHQEGMIFSSDGHCKTFDEAADGTIVGEGAGAVVLKRLSEAMKDGDHIYAMIKGSAINNDGLRKIGYTAPSIEGQVDCIKMAHTISKIDPNSIDYVEAHGTATKLGDPIEIEALNKAFNNNSTKHCLIGSVKSNIGHLDAAAGVSGLIKTVLALKNKVIPASLHFKKENPQIPFAEGPFEVVSKTQAWPQKAQRVRRAGVSSFGIGGTNAHVVLEEAPKAGVSAAENRFDIFPLSANHESSVQAYLDRFYSFLKKHPEVNLSNVAYTLQKGRKHFPYRTAIVAANHKSLLEQVQQKIEQAKTITKQQTATTIFLFSGQGSQYHQMGADLYQHHAFFKKQMDLGFDHLQQQTGMDYRELLYGDSSKATLIHQTKYTQPLLFIFEYALAQLLMHHGIQPTLMMGHSLGEYVAATISGVFDYADAIKIILKRAALISSLPEGSMLSITAQEEDLKPYLAKGLDLAAINAPNQCVLSGEDAVIQELVQSLEKEGRQHQVLKTSHAFHSAMMDPILDTFAEYLQSFELRPPKLPFVSNVSGTLIEANSATSPKYWVQHLRQAVQFAKGAQTLSEWKNAQCIEIGPGNRLIRLLKQNKDKAQILLTASSVRNAKKDIDDEQHLLDNLALLWTNGTAINWAAFHPEEGRYKVALPTYVFQKSRFEATVPIDQLNNGTSSKTTKEKKGSVTKALVVNPTPATQKSETIAKDLSKLSETAIQVEVIEVWKSFFGNEEIDVQSDFFELGGDSLKAMSMINIIHERFNAEISVTDFMEKSKVSDVVEELQNITWVNQDKTLTNKLTI
ncbi:MAG: beta-ketoacyl synthase N-terminal-like domain-containing protein [Bacteroidota bacterium]